MHSRILALSQMRSDDAHKPRLADKLILPILSTLLNYNTNLSQKRLNDINVSNTNENFQHEAKLR